MKTLWQLRLDHPRWALPRDRAARLDWPSLAGLGTLFFYYPRRRHSFVYFWPEGYEHAIRLYQTPVFFVGELLLVAAVIYHGVNGIRVAVLDWKPQLWQYQRPITLATFALVALLYIPAAAIMISHLVRAWTEG